MTRSRGTLVALATSVAALVIVPSAALGVVGDFVQPATSPEAVGDSPESLAAANLGGDANTDLAVPNLLDGDVSILLGDGSGNFEPAGTSPETVGGQPAGVAVGSFNGDANLDLATANDSTDNVSILLGDGTGNFTPAGTSPETVGDGPNQLVAANLGGDANTDLAVANSNADTISILLGDGTGNFTAAGTEASTDVPAALTAANFDGDADLDLAVANVATDDVTILLGDGTGAFTAAAGSPEGAGDAPRGIAAGSFGGSASLDLAVANSGSDNVSILLGDGTGNFTAAGTSPEPAGDSPRAVLSAALAGGAGPALAVANQGEDTLSILGGDGTGNFTPLATSPEGTGESPTAIAAGQLGSTASTDLAVANADSDDVTILINDTLVPPVIPAVPPPTVAPPTTTAPTGRRAAALKKCKKKRGKARRNCKKKANKLPV